MAWTEYQRLYYRKNRRKIAWRARVRRKKPSRERLEKIRAYQRTERGYAANRAGVLNTMAKRYGSYNRLTADDLLGLAACECGGESRWWYRVSPKDGGDAVVANVIRGCTECRSATQTKK